MWQFSKINFLKFNSRMLKVLNSQLLAMLLWVAPVQILTLAHKQNLLTQFLKEVIVYESKYTQEQERARSILGLSTLIALPEKPQEILEKMPDIFKTVLKLVRKSAEDRLDYDPNAHYEDDEEEEESDEFDFAEDDDEFWQEQYDDNYASALDSIDEVAGFKDMITKLAAEQTAFYQELIKAVPQEDLILTEEKIQKALEKVEA